jgi:hypothetical protein
MSRAAALATRARPVRASRGGAARPGAVRVLDVLPAVGGDEAHPSARAARAAPSPRLAAGARFTTYAFRVNVTMSDGLPGAWSAWVTFLAH